MASLDPSRSRSGRFWSTPASARDADLLIVAPLNHTVNPTGGPRPGIYPHGEDSALESTIWWSGSALSRGIRRPSERGGAAAGSSPGRAAGHTASAPGSPGPAADSGPRVPARGGPPARSACRRTRGGRLSGRGNQKHEPPAGLMLTGGLEQQLPAATYSPGDSLPSTIGAGGLDDRVRNGNGYDPSAIATGKLMTDGQSDEPLAIEHWLPPPETGRRPLLHQSASMRPASALKKIRPSLTAD